MSLLHSQLIYLRAPCGYNKDKIWASTKASPTSLSKEIQHEHQHSCSPVYKVLLLQMLAGPGHIQTQTQQVQDCQ